MELSLTDTAKDDLRFFGKSGQKQVLKKIEQLLSEMQVTPFDGTGKPEPLKYGLTGIWSRRINLEHRIVYEVIDNVVVIYSFRGHYQR